PIPVCVLENVVNETRPGLAKKCWKKALPMTVPARNVASISVNAYVELLIVIARSRVQAISYAKAVLPTMANRKSRKANVACCGSAAAEVTVAGEPFSPRRLLGSFAIRRASRPARILRATAEATVTRKPNAGSRTNPEINVLATAPRVLTQ